MPALTTPARHARLATRLAMAGVLVVIGLSTFVRAGPSIPVVTLDPSDVRAAGRTVEASTTALGSEGLVDTRFPLISPPPRVLALSPDGAVTAVVGLTGPGAGPLTVVSDTTQLDVAIANARAAVFATDGSRLSALDQAGGLWLVDPSNGNARSVAAGPFAPPVGVLDDGRLVLNRVSSVEAPTWSTAVTIAASGADETPVDPAAGQDGLDYGAIPLADGSIALVRHRVGGGVSIMRFALDGSSTEIGRIDGATEVTVSSDATHAAWVEAGRMRLAALPSAAGAIDLGQSLGARFSPQGELLLVFTTGGTTVVDRAGATVGQFGPNACWTASDEGCRP